MREQVTLCTVLPHHQQTTERREVARQVKSIGVAVVKVSGFEGSEGMKAREEEKGRRRKGNEEEAQEEQRTT